MWQTAYDYFSDSKLILDCLTTLDNCNNGNRWKNFDVDDFLSIINSTGIGLSFFYGYSWLEAQIIDENKNKFLDRRRVKWRKLKEKGLIRLCIYVNNPVNKPTYPPKCLNRLLNILKKEFGYYIIENQTITLIQTNTSDNIPYLFLKLCDILYKERIKCHNDIKKYLYKNWII